MVRFRNDENSRRNYVNTCKSRLSGISALDTRNSKDFHPARKLKLYQLQ